MSGITFDIEQGEVLGIVGPVGAGKTSLCMALAGFIPQVTGGSSTGELTVCGLDPREVSNEAMAYRVGMVFEDYTAQLTQPTVLSEVMSPLLNRGVSREESEDRARKLLDTVSLTEQVDKRTWELSGGQQQQVAIATTLAMDPDVIIFDSATGMLDPMGTADVRTLINELAGETTLVIAQNDPDMLIGLTDHVLVLSAGESVAFGPPEQVLRDEDLLDQSAITPPVCLRAARALDLFETPLTAAAFEEAVKSSTLSEVDSEQPATDGDRPGETLVRISDVTYQYPDGTTALSNVDLEVRAGGVHAIIGGNGAGKTTLGKLLVGLLEPMSGRISIDGVDTYEQTASELARTIGIALQNPDERLSERTVESEIAFPLHRHQYERTGLLSKRKHYDNSYIDHRVSCVSELVGLEQELHDRDPTLLPRGQRQLVAIAQALSLDPSVLILDEPTVGLDSAARRRVGRTISRLQEMGKAVILIEHDMDFVCDVADTVTVLDDGSVALAGSTRDVFTKHSQETLSEWWLRLPRAGQLASRIGVDALTLDELVSKLTSIPEVS
ncbi:ABC transporter ATP-binding protein [Halocatena pleomorpha]|uniref:ABC transporter ATP-binding protein n=1 Tax=Halocatena pleomorpha TaxID=1785090 RepID=UPI00163A081F|nr:ATP-binding cassette domain-containing protein [Halocatena pleomorpha]